MARREFVSIQCVLFGQSFNASRRNFTRYVSHGCYIAWLLMLDFRLLWIWTLYTIRPPHWQHLVYMCGYMKVHNPCNPITCDWIGDNELPITVAIRLISNRWAQLHNRLGRILARNCTWHRLCELMWTLRGFYAFIPQRPPVSGHYISRIMEPWKPFLWLLKSCYLTLCLLNSWYAFFYIYVKIILTLLMLGIAISIVP